MKKLFTLILGAALSVSAFAQTEEYWQFGGTKPDDGSHENYATTENVTLSLIMGDTQEDKAWKVQTNKSASGTTVNGTSVSW